jgi:hypothetical protein
MSGSLLSAVGIGGGIAPGMGTTAADTPGGLSNVYGVTGVGGGGARAAGPIELEYDDVPPAAAAAAAAGISVNLLSAVGIGGGMAPGTGTTAADTPGGLSNVYGAATPGRTRGGGGGCP